MPAVCVSEGVNNILPMTVVRRKTPELNMDWISSFCCKDIKNV